MIDERIGMGAAARVRGMTCAVGMLLIAMTLSGCGSTDPADAAPPRPVALRYEIVKKHPHDPHAFTQGLFYHDGKFYEGTGQKGESSLREVEIETGKVLRRVDLADRYFGEGICKVGDNIVQLTWRAREAFVYRLSDFEHIETFRYSGEGWGITYDGTHLIMSNGKPYLRFLDPKTYKEVRVLLVKDGDRAATAQLNELEYIDGQVWANSFNTDDILRIDPETGQITGRLDCTGLLKGRRADDIDRVLNGIAHDPTTGRIWITGKDWPTIFEIKVREP